MSADRTDPKSTGAADTSTQTVHRGHEGTASRIAFELLRLAARAIIPFVAKLRVEGLEQVPRQGGVILAPNHINWVDIPLVAYPVPRVTHFMAKAELFGVPFLGGFIRVMGAFPVRRGEGDREALRIAERLLAEGELVTIFPEGHRSEERALIEAHTGVALIALRAGVPVVPVAIWGSEQTFHDGRYLWRRPTITIRYGAPVKLAAAGTRRTSADIKRCTDEVMGRIASMLPPRYRGIYAHLVPDDAATDVPAASPTNSTQTPAQPT
jgi:1-acyl-sn-glycerol-3-phosphate acyltransferase